MCCIEERGLRLETTFIWMDQSLHEAFIRYKVILADIEGIRIVDEESETIVPDIEY